LQCHDLCGELALTEIQHADKHKPSITAFDVQLQKKTELGADRQIDACPASNISCFSESAV
jgi:hypothetical protein